MHPDYLLRDNEKLLYCCESGSRAWGFASENSDFDIRFIYQSPLKKYLLLKSFDDTITKIDGIYDYHGWDLKKTMQLAIATNPSLVEWVKSPIVYFNTNNFQEKLKNILEKYGNIYALAKSYQSLCANVYKDKILKKEPTAKAYLYCIRAMLAYSYIDFYESLPPIEIDKLVTEEENEEIANKTQYLIEIKNHSENNKVINDIIFNKKIEKFLTREPSFKPRKTDSKPFQDLFYEIIGI